VSVARALLADAPILVLDEATAFADPESEAAIPDALSELEVDSHQARRHTDRKKSDSSHQPTSNGWDPAAGRERLARDIRR
jgi:hypothetical protein